MRQVRVARVVEDHRRRGCSRAPLVVDPKLEEGAAVGVGHGGGKEARAPHNWRKAGDGKAGVEDRGRGRIAGMAEVGSGVKVRLIGPLGAMCDESWSD